MAILKAWLVCLSTLMVAGCFPEDQCKAFTHECLGQSSGRVCRESTWTLEWREFQCEPALQCVEDSETPRTTCAFQGAPDPLCDDAPSANAFCDAEMGLAIQCAGPYLVWKIACEGCRIDFGAVCTKSAGARCDLDEDCPADLLCLPTGEGAGKECTIACEVNADCAPILVPGECREGICQR